MRIITTILLTIFLSSMFGQTTPLKNVEELINDNCIGSPTTRSLYRETVTFKALDKNNVQVIVENYELNTGNLTRKNKFTFKLSDLDPENMIIKAYGDYYGIFLYTKDFKKTIKQSTLFVNEARTSVINQELICISEFRDKEILEEIKTKLVQAINLSTKK